MYTSQIQEVKAILVKLSEDMGEVKSDVAVLKSYVIGNGTDGLARRVDRLEQGANEQRGERNLLRWIVPLSLTASSLVATVIARL